MAALRKAVVVDDNSDVSPIPVSKDKDATWVKKAGRFYLGYKLHASSDEQGYLKGIHVTAANAHESRHLSPLLEELPKSVEVLADKGYSSKRNRAELRDCGLKDGTKQPEAVPSRRMSSGVTMKSKMSSLAKTKALKV